MTKSSRQSVSPVRVIVMTMLDTTWRVFVPPIGGVAVGVLIDNLFKIAPIATAICLVAGTGLSIFLIAKQLSKVQKSI